MLRHHPTGINLLLIAPLGQVLQGINHCIGVIPPKDPGQHHIGQAHASGGNRSEESAFAHRRLLGIISHQQTDDDTCIEEADGLEVALTGWRCWMTQPSRNPR